MESKQTTQDDQVDFKTLILIGTASIVNRKRYNPISEVQIVRFPINPSLSRKMKTDSNS